jgi:hypothetical protein
VTGVTFWRFSANRGPRRGILLITPTIGCRDLVIRHQCTADHKPECGRLWLNVGCCRYETAKSGECHDSLKMLHR